MIRLFVDRDAFSMLMKREFCKNEGERMSRGVDIVPVARTQVVEFDTQKKIYSIKESTRDDHGDWKSHENGITINDVR